MWGLVIPTIIMTIFGLINFDKMGFVNLGVVDRAQNELSGQLIEAFEGIEVLQVEQGDLGTMNTKVEEGDVDLLLVIPENLSLAEVQKSGQPLALELLANQANSEQVGTGTLLVSQVLMQFSLQVSQTSPLFVLDEKLVDGRDLNYMDYLIPGIVGMMIMQLGIIGVAMIVVRYRELGVLKRLRVTPMKPAVFLLSLVSTRLLLLMTQAGVIVLMGVLLFDLHLYGNFLYIFVTALLGSLVFLSLGFAVSGVAKTMNTAMSMAQLIQMPMMFLSGTFFPREAFPDWLQKVTDYLPLTYLADALRETMIENATLMDVKHLLIPLVVWAMGGFFLATKLFRWE